MDYLKIPTEVSSNDIRNKEFSWAPGMYQRVEIPNPNTQSVSDLLDPMRFYDKGTEPGSLYYVEPSIWKLIRTKALQEHSTLLYPKGEAIVALNPKGVKDWSQFDLKDGDLLMAKDSNVGECVMVDGDGWKNYAWSNGIVRLHPRENKFYFFAFVKHPLFKAQLLAMLPRGVTITHAKNLWLDCKIPLPNQPDDLRVISYVSTLIQAAMEKEKAIRERNEQIEAAIAIELAHSKAGTVFQYEFPNIHEIRSVGRLDTGFYTPFYKETMFRINNYRGGAGNLKAWNMKSRRGPNLAISVSGQSLYRSHNVSGDYYRLVLPSSISDYRTINEEIWLGNPRALERIKHGDILFSARGDMGRTVIFPEHPGKATTNFDGILVNTLGALELHSNIFVGLMFEHYRRLGLLEAIGHGSGAASFTSDHIENLLIPKFPDEVQASIARLYHNPDAAQPDWAPTLETFIEWHRAWNEQLGIWELDREMKALQATLREVQEQIILGETVSVPLA